MSCETTGDRGADELELGGGTCPVLRMTHAIGRPQVQPFCAYKNLNPGSHSSPIVPGLVAMEEAEFAPASRGARLVNGSRKFRGDAVRRWRQLRFGSPCSGRCGLGPANVGQASVKVYPHGSAPSGSLCEASAIAVVIANDHLKHVLSPTQSGVLSNSRRSCTLSSAHHLKLSCSLGAALLVLGHHGSHERAEVPL